MQITKYFKQIPLKSTIYAYTWLNNILFFMQKNGKKNVQTFHSYLAMFNLIIAVCGGKELEGYNVEL